MVKANQIHQWKEVHYEKGANETEYLSTYCHQNNFMCLFQLKKILKSLKPRLKGRFSSALLEDPSLVPSG